MLLSPYYVRFSSVAGDRHHVGRAANAEMMPFSSPEVATAMCDYLNVAYRAGLVEALCDSTTTEAALRLLTIVEETIGTRGLSTAEEWDRLDTVVLAAMLDRAGLSARRHDDRPAGVLEVQALVDVLQREDADQWWFALCAVCADPVKAPLAA